MRIVSFTRGAVLKEGQRIMYARPPISSCSTADESHISQGYNEFGEIHVIKAGPLDEGGMYELCNNDSGVAAGNLGVDHRGFAFAATLELFTRPARNGGLSSYGVQAGAITGMALVCSDAIAGVCGQASDVPAWPLARTDGFKALAKAAYNGKINRT